MLKKTYKDAGMWFFGDSETIRSNAGWTTEWKLWLAFYRRFGSAKIGSKVWIWVEEETICSWGGSNWSSCSTEYGHWEDFGQQGGGFIGSEQEASPSQSVFRGGERSGSIFWKKREKESTKEWVRKSFTKSGDSDDQVQHSIRPSSEKEIDQVEADLSGQQSGKIHTLLTAAEEKQRS